MERSTPVHGLPSVPTVEPLAIDAHAGRHHQPADGFLDQRLQQDCGANVVHLRVLGDLVHALPDPDRRD